MNKPLILIGSGGHAAVLLDILIQQARTVIAVVSPDESLSREIFSGLLHLKSDTEVLNYSPDSIELVNGIGSLPMDDNALSQRVKLFRSFTEKGYKFATIVSADAIVSKYASLGEGAQILPRALIHTGTSIARNTIVNSAAVIEHDCVIGAHNHIAPGAVLSGAVRTGDYVHIGTGACVIQGIEVGTNSVIGAGATVLKDTAEKTITYPARCLVKRKPI